MMIETTQETTGQHVLTTPAGVRIEYERFGTGPALVLVHGSFTDHRTNWKFVASDLADHFTVHALARRGRGQTDATEGHSIEEEAADAAALIRTIEGPVHLLGHSYGAQVALAAARMVGARIEKLVLYEPPLTDIVSSRCLAALEKRADAGDWEGFVITFMREVVSLSSDELAEMRENPLWPQFVADAPATRREIPALPEYDFDPAGFAGLSMPVMLQTGSESRGGHWATDALAGVLPDARIVELPGQGHDAMFTAPDLYARQVIDFLHA